MLRLGVMVMAAFALSASPALAVTANDDGVTAYGSGTLDVLGNDSVGTGEQLAAAADAPLDLRVTGVTQPAHGTASCGALGGCLYVAADGYEGDDSFTYTAGDGSTSASATVTVEVRQNIGGFAATASDDDLTVPYQTAGSVNVLGNDSFGAPVVSSTDPPHGTASCTGAGICTYTPDAGFSGGDGFRYTSSDEEISRSAFVHVLVGPPGAGYDQAVGGSPAQVLQGTDASWFVAVSAKPDHVSDVVLKTLPLPETTADLDGVHDLKPASVATAQGWTADPPANANRRIKARAGTGAALGESVSDVIPQPLGSVSQGTGGDGHVPILVGSKVFAFFHHQTNTQVSCVDRSTGSGCPGYPKQTTVSTSEIPGPGVVVGKKIYVHLQTKSQAGGGGAFAETAPIAVYCWDTSTDSTCGLTVVDRMQQNDEPAGSAIVSVGDNMYLTADTGKLYCLTKASVTPCLTPSVSTGFAAGDSFGPIEYDGLTNFDIITHGTRIYVGRDAPASQTPEPTVACLDTATGAPCAGWSTPKAFGGRWDVVNHFAGGVADGVCVVSATVATNDAGGECVTDADPATRTPIGWFDDAYGMYEYTQEAETGTRSFQGSLNRQGIGCWDWTPSAGNPNGAPCTGGSYLADGWLEAGFDGGTSFYGSTYDGSCVVALGDSGKMHTVDPNGSTPCTSLSAGTERRTIDLRDARCDGTVGNASFFRALLRDAGEGDFSRVTLTVRDASTGAVLASGDVTEGPLDLSGIDAAAHPAITVDATGDSTGGGAWEDGVFPRIDVEWNNDPKSLCFKTTPPVDCVAPLDPIAVSAQLTGAEAVQRKELGILRAACDPVLDELPNKQIDEETQVTASVAASDPNGGTLTFSLVNPPAGATINASTGAFAWTPTEAQGPSTATITVKVTDDTGRSSTRSFTVQVYEVNLAPVLEPIADRTAQPGALVSVQPSASDPDLPANKLTFSLLESPTGATIDPATGKITWTAAEAGAHVFTVKVTDGAPPVAAAKVTLQPTYGMSARRTFKVTVQGDTTGGGGVETPTPTPTVTAELTPTVQPTAEVTPAPTPEDEGEVAGEEVLGCSDRKIVLVDVAPHGHRVRLSGVTTRAYAGRTVRIYFRATRKQVATAKVRKDGSFSTTAPAPPKSLRFGNRARYQARIAGQRSLDLKLYRRMRLTSVKTTRTTVTFKGHLIKPLAITTADRAIYLQRVVNCKRLRTIKRFFPKADGTFAVTVAAPKGRPGAVYRMKTHVKRNHVSKRIIETYTLPRPVDFK